jgi:hypothetical protein
LGAQILPSGVVERTLVTERAPRIGTWEGRMAAMRIPSTIVEDMAAVENHKEILLRQTICIIRIRNYKKRGRSSHPYSNQFKRIVNSLIGK